MITSAAPGLSYETALLACGLRHVAGLDEAGRGAWAGPVVAGAVILPLDRDDLAKSLNGVRDSKLLTPAQREALYPVVWELAAAAAIGVASAREVEEHNVVGATRLAMMRALEGLPIAPEALLIDGRTLRLRRVNLPQQSLRGGELVSLSIAAASILAKVARDQMMVELDAEFPGYGFAQHKGYGTRLHQAALEKHGPCPAHRRTYRPVQDTFWNGPPDEDRAGT